MKTFYAGVSGRQVGILFGMNKSNVYNWIKKTDQVWASEQTVDVLELDELDWFIGQKGKGETPDHDGEPRTAPNRWVCGRV